MAELVSTWMDTFSRWCDGWSLENQFKKQQHLSLFIDHRFDNINIREAETHLQEENSGNLGRLHWFTRSTYRLNIRFSCSKFGKELKLMIDRLLKHGIEDVTVSGTLVDGYAVTTSSLRLVSDGVYLMGSHGAFHFIAQS
ncbi:predicted protein [Lichtheimia corymbifera JMRC:FSU:9682]|uniref:Uncharacterized protein n=1 Tax=Lichtheimia corymbifera JMRC:FSU:9682 TaxID=1263082 RepID=A0A068SDT7_9FUNG|nr:predicted protein [Lichtheimia corymbifera JMRC:FSU:9682]